MTTGYWGSSAHSTVGGQLSTLLRLSGAPHDVVNPNQLAWVIVSMVPFVFYLLWKGGVSGKILALLAAPSFLYSLLLTGSRSGLLSLIFVLLAMVYFSRRRVRNLVVVAVIAFPVALYSFGILGSDMQTRYLSLVDDTVAGADTVQGRIDGWGRGIKSISNNPLFGNGLGTSRETNFNVLGGRAQITHNLYLEIFQETGLVGFTLFMLFIVAIFKSLRETKLLLAAQGRKESDWLFRLATATQVWLVMDLFYSLSCFGLRSWEWYFFGGIATLCLALARQRAVSEVVAEPIDAKPVIGFPPLSPEISKRKEKSWGSALNELANDRKIDLIHPLKNQGDAR
jgi:O-antigen ligase